MDANGDWIPDDITSLHLVAAWEYTMIRKDTFIRIRPSTHISVAISGYHGRLVITQLTKPGKYHVNINYLTCMF